MSGWKMLTESGGKMDQYSFSYVRRSDLSAHVEQCAAL